MCVDQSTISFVVTYWCLVTLVEQYDYVILNSFREIVLLNIFHLPVLLLQSDLPRQAQLVKRSVVG